MRYSKAVDGSESQLRFVVSIEFELGISDEPTLSYREARSYAFNGVRLDVYDRQMEQLSNIEFDTETEVPRLVGSAYLQLTTLRQVEELTKLLKFDGRGWF